MRLENSMVLFRPAWRQSFRSEKMKTIENTLPRFVSKSRTLFSKKELHAWDKYGQACSKELIANDKRNLRPCWYVKTSTAKCIFTWGIPMKTNNSLHQRRRMYGRKIKRRSQHRLMHIWKCYKETRRKLKLRAKNVWPSTDNNHWLHNT